MLTNEEIKKLVLASGFKLLGEFTKPDFKFVSELAYTTMKDMADELGWEVHKISGVYNSRILLTKDEIHQLNVLMMN